MRQAVILSMVVTLFIISCDELINRDRDEEELTRIDIIGEIEDDNGYFHVSPYWDRFMKSIPIHGNIYIDQNQNGQIDYPSEPLDKVIMNFSTSHLWYPGDTLGYITQLGTTSEYQYVSDDTTYLIDHLEPGDVHSTITCCAYSDSLGEFLILFYPTKKMVGDTVRVDVDIEDTRATEVKKFMSIVIH